MMVIGTGLIGTSVALAARRAGVTVYLADREPGTARVAEALGAGSTGPPPGPVDLAVLAVPPSAVGPVLRTAQAGRVASSYTDVASVKGEPERAVLSLAPDPAAYIGGHPMAGRERSGPLAASADLFAGRPWLLTPHPRTGRAAAERAEALAQLCGGVPVVLSSRAHDDAVALTSHVPHLLASLMAARLAAAPAGIDRLAGRGVRDVTRIAAGDPVLWSDIVEANAPAIVAVLRELRSDLDRLLGGVETVAHAEGSERERGHRVIVDLLERGVSGASRISGGPCQNPAGSGT
jgi:prephenate dehydrogenase